MITSTKRFCLILVALLLSLISFPSWADQAPDRLIEELTQELYTLIEENRQAYESDTDALKADVNDRMRQHIDTIYSARLVLGRHGRGLETQKIAAFADALSTALMDEYATRLLDFDSENTVEVMPLEPDQDPRRTRVRTRLKLDNGSIMPVDYILRQHDGRWQVFDVIAEGISYVATFRNQIGEQISRIGFEATLAGLQKGDVVLDADES
ncbi:MAG TPA: ABC transporter substrate-binding protein [Wenzhouxiangella sp.]